MPELGNRMHLNMLQATASEVDLHWAIRRGFADRETLQEAIKNKRLTGRDIDGKLYFQVSDLEAMFGPSRRTPEIYGLQWGDPEDPEQVSLATVRDAWLLPYISSDSVVLEIGPGGGRWTRYMLDAQKIYAVDMFEGVLDELRKANYSDAIEYVLNSGTDFPGVADASVDLVFSFGVFVHLEADAIGQYLSEIGRVLKPGTGRCILQFANKNKKLAAENKGFGHMTPDLFRTLTDKSPLEITKLDDDLLHHSTIAELALSA